MPYAFVAFQKGPLHRTVRRVAAFGEGFARAHRDRGATPFSLLQLARAPHGTLFQVMQKNHSPERNLPADWAARILPGMTVLCDLDGTLVHTDLANNLAYAKAVEAVTRGSRTLSWKLGQRITRSNLRQVLPGLTEPEYQRIVSLKKAYERDFLGYTVPNAPLISLLRNVIPGVSIVLATHCSKRRAMLTLDYHGLTELFARIICVPVSPDDTTADKYRRVLADLSLDPQAVVVFEDDQTQIQGAAAAGVPTNQIFSIQWR
jgi:beta-phosphoglucomutase-like phosphatase (HAD superfamily)